MTNFQSFAGSLVWAAVAGALMLVTFAPVGPDAAQSRVHIAAKAQVASSHTAL